MTTALANAIEVSEKKLNSNQVNFFKNREKQASSEAGVIPVRTSITGEAIHINIEMPDLMGAGFTIHDRVIAKYIASRKVLRVTTDQINGVKIALKVLQAGTEIAFAQLAKQKANFPARYKSKITVLEAAFQHGKSIEIDLSSIVGDGPTKKAKTPTQPNLPIIEFKDPIADLQKAWRAYESAIKACELDGYDPVLEDKSTGVTVNPAKCRLALVRRQPVRIDIT